MANLKSSTLNGNLSVNGSISLNGEILDLSKFITSETAKSYLTKTGGTMTGKLVVPQIEIGTGSENYFECRKFRGEGNANIYYHAIDFGYTGHDHVDFHEYGGLFNFYKNTAGTANSGQLIGSITDRGFVGGAELTGTPTAPTAAKGTNTTQIATTEFVQSAVSELNNEKVNYGDALLTTNPFGGKHLYISKIDNAFYAADKRWTVSGKLYDAATDEYKGDIGSISNLFDGNYEGGGVSIPIGQYALIKIDFNTTPSGHTEGYPYGDILISFYYSNVPASLTARAYCNFESQGIGWHDLTGSYFYGSASSTAAVIYKFRNDFYAISTFEFKIYSKSDITCSPVQIEMNLDRPDPSKTPVLSKYRPETLYYPLACPEFKGNLTGTAKNATNDSNGNKITSTYIKGLSARGQTVTYTKGDGSTGTITTQEVSVSSTQPTGDEILWINPDGTSGGGSSGGGSVTVDTSLSSTSTNPVQNKVVTSALNSKVSKTDYASQTNAGVAKIWVDSDNYLCINLQ